MQQQIQRGLIHVYTGNGKGKTTASLGLALRAAGHGMTTVIVQFIKSAECGEHRALESLGPLVQVLVAGNGFVRDEPGTADLGCASSALRTVRTIMAGRGCDILVLDEINCALSLGLVELQEVLDLLAAKPPEMELVLTGRGAPPEVVSRADLVTEMKAVKHPFEQGRPARAGIEY